MASATTIRRPVRPDDLFNLTFIGDVAVSPDGGTICYVQTRMDRETNEYRSDLWTTPATGHVGDAVRFTSEPRTVGQPRWSPDGRWLAFLSDRDGKGKRHLWVIPTVGIGGEARRLTRGDMPVSDYAWAPDSTRLVFVRGEKIAPPPKGEPLGRVTDDVLTVTRIRNKADGRGFIYDRRNHLWAVDLDGAESRLTEGDHDNTSPVWSPDGNEIVFVSKRMADADFTNTTELYVIPATGGEARRLPTPEGPVDAPAWSPDGTRIAFVGSGRANVAGAVSRLWVIPSSAGVARNLTPTLDLNIGLDVSSDSRAGLTAPRPVWSPQSDALFFLASTRGTTPLWRVALDGGEPERIVDGLRQVQSFAVSRDGGTIALNLADGLNPGDLFVSADPRAEPRRLTDANGAFFATVTRISPEAFTYEGAEGWQVHGWLVPPVGRRDGETYPLVLAIHGGPHTAYGEMFFFEFQCLAAQGMGVLFINPRGSTGYGERFAIASNNDWGGNDYRDLMLGVDAAIARAPWIDSARLGVTGGSFGGYMTNWIITQTTRFKAAVALRSICNMTSKWGVSDIGYLGNDLQWGGPPWENQQFYLDRSPLTHVTSVVTPLLLIHSERDLRCPIEQAEQFFTALKYLRRAVEFVRFPDEGHELSRSGQPLHRLERLERITKWFCDHLWEFGVQGLEEVPMERPTRNAALLEKLEGERRSWEALLTEIGEERMERPGVNGEWTFKDMMSHLIAYRRQTVSRLQAAVQGTEPSPPPWPPEWDDNDVMQLDRINAYIYEANKGRTLADVLAESRVQFGQMRDAVRSLSDDALFTPNHFFWLEGWPLAAVLDSSYRHLHEEHEPDIRAWLDRTNAGR